MAKSFSFNPFTGNFDLISEVSLAAVGSSPNANAASISSAQVLILQPFDSTHPGVVPASGGGTANFLRADGTWASPSGTGVTSITAVGAVPNANGGSISGSALTLQPANTSFPGVLLAADWNTFNGKQAAGNYIIALTGDVTAAGPGSVAATIGANKVLDTMIRQSAGLSLIGRSANSTGNVADITAASDGQIMRRSGTAIGFGSIDLASSAAVSTSILGVANGGTGLATLTANNVILGNGSSTPTFVAPGTSGNVLKSNGTTWTSAANTATGTLPTTQIFTSNGTYTKPTSPAPVWVKVTVIGSGGGGNTGCTLSGGGGGGAGGAGGCAIRFIAAGSVGATETVTVPAGAAAATGGGTSSFGSLASATGGNAGAAGNNGNFSPGAGGAGGAGSSGTVNFTGNGGSCGGTGTAGAFNGIGGTGGGSFMGGGGIGGGSGTNGSAGGNYGAGGGGGGAHPSAPGTGGAGSGGIVIVEEYY